MIIDTLHLGLYDVEAPTVRTTTQENVEFQENGDEKQQDEQREHSDNMSLSYILNETEKTYPTIDFENIMTPVILQVVKLS